MTDARCAPVHKCTESRRSSTKLRIALFSGNYHNVVDGPARALNRLVGWLIDQGHNVRIFAPTIDQPAIPPTGTVISVPSIAIPGRGEYRLAFGIDAKPNGVSNPPAGFRPTGTIRSQLDDFAPDIIHLTAPDRLGFSALDYAHASSIPAVASFHTRFDEYLRYYHIGFLQPVMRTLMRSFYGRCEHVYVPSRSMAQNLRNQKIGRDIRFWARGADHSQFSPTHRDIGWRRQNGIKDKDVAILFVGRIVREKGLDVFAQTIRRAHRVNPAIKALIVGQGPERARFANLLPVNSIFTGYLGGNDLARAYASADIFLNPSSTETFGNVTLEAMASGLPTVCAAASGTVCLVQPGITGLTGAPRAKSLAPLVQHLAANASERKKMGTAARLASKSYDWEEIFAGLLADYHAAILSYRDREKAPIAYRQSNNCDRSAVD